MKAMKWEGRESERDEMEGRERCEKDEMGRKEEV